MPYGVYLPGRWRSQPQGAVEVDWGHPLARGLGLVLNAATRSNHATGAIATASVSAAFTPTPAGIGLIGGGTLTSRVAVPFGTRQTVAILAHVASWRTGGANVGSSSAGVLTFAFSVGQNGEVSASTVNSSFQAVQVSLPSGTAEVGRPGVLVGRMADDVIDVYYGRAKSAPSASFVPYTSTSQTVTQQGYAEVSTAGMFAWGRALSEAEIYALVENPWQFLRPRRPIVYSLPSSTPVLSAATVIDIGSTSVRPRVTITI